MAKSQDDTAAPAAAPAPPTRAVLAAALLDIIVAFEATAEDRPIPNPYVLSRLRDARLLLGD